MKETWLRGLKEQKGDRQKHKKEEFVEQRNKNDGLSINIQQEKVQNKVGIWKQIQYANTRQSRAK